MAKGFQKGHTVSPETREKISKANDGSFLPNVITEVAMDRLTRRDANGFVEAEGENNAAD